MKAALQILGYDDVYHMTNTWTSPQDVDMWVEAYNAKLNGTDKPFGRAGFDKLLGHCMAVTDAPAIDFGPELIEAYPDAKIILVDRDIESWYKTMEPLINSNFRLGLLIFAWLDPFYAGRLWTVTRRNMALTYRAGTAIEAKANARQAFKDHYARIRNAAPKDRLLEYKLGSGWEPLCKFLGKPIPDAEFPKLNESELFREMADVVNMKCLERSLANLGFALVAVIITVFTVLSAATYISTDKHLGWHTEL
jgi:Sulfotransferase domain